MVENHPRDGHISSVIGRHLKPALVRALSDRQVVPLHGDRQSGKTTLVRQVAAGDHPATYLLPLNAAAMLAAAGSDPEGFVAELGGPVAWPGVQSAS
jgi:hypothetical protein